MNPDPSLQLFVSERSPRSRENSRSTIVYCVPSLKCLVQRVAVKLKSRLPDWLVFHSMVLITCKEEEKDGLSTC